jgi:hypothetical protein
MTHATDERLQADRSLPVETKLYYDLFAPASIEAIS